MEHHGAPWEHHCTIQDIVRLTGKSKTTVYRYLKQGKLKYETVEHHGNTIFYVEKGELERFLGYKVEHHGTPHETPMEHHGTPPALTEETLINAIEKYFSTKQSELMKPIEQQALFLAGKYQAENEFLRQQVETLRNELDAVKALPVDIEKKDEEIRILQKQLSILPVEPEKIPELLKLEAEKFSQIEEKCIKEVQEKEDLRKTLQEEQEQGRKQTQEKEHLEEQLKNLQQEAEEMRQKLSRPWWKIW